MIGKISKSVGCKFPVYFIILLSFITLSAENEYQIPLFNISVTGNVNNPGIYHLPPTSRISEAILRANIPSQIPNTEDLTIKKIVYRDNIASTRNIVLKRGTDSISLDLEKFYVSGDISQNPYISDGDIIIVPVLQEKVLVNGAINKSGEFELVQGDRITDIIKLAFGLRNDAYLSKAEVVRFVNDIETDIYNISLSEIMANPESDQNILLENDDRIYIRSISEFHETNSIIVYGEVEFPGTYYINENQTTLLSILEKCGGPTSDSDLKNAFIQRRSKDGIIDPEFERLKKMLVQDMTQLEYEYFKTKSREQRGKYSVDFVDLWTNRDQNKDIILKDNDYIYFPGKIVTVSVSGQVKNPGLITFVQGKNYEYYIEQAGGFSWNPRKNKIRVIRASTDEWLRPKQDTIIEVGDMIFVPEKPEFDYWEFAKDFMGFAAQIATVYLVVKSALN